MSNNDVKKLCSLLRLLLDKLEQDPEGVMEFLKGPRTHTQTKSPPRTTRSDFNPLAFYFQNGKDSALLEKKLKKFRLDELKAIAKGIDSAGGRMHQNTKAKAPIIDTIIDAVVIRSRRLNEDAVT